MSTSLVINGVTFTFPELSEKDWGINVTAWATAVTAAILPKTGGNFQLTGELDFGSAYGLKSIYYKSRSSNIASAGQVRLANTDVVSWRNYANDDNLNLSVDSSDTLLFDGIELITDMSSKLDVSAFTDAAVTSKVITGYSPGAGTVLETDTILESIGKICGNISAIGDVNFHESPKVTMTYKNDDEITISAGWYYCGDAWLEQSASYDWTFALDTGSRAHDTWYYLYAYNNSGAVGYVCSVTAPTSKFNTSLYGDTYDSNVYLGAFYSSYPPPTGPNKIVPFSQTGNRFIYCKGIGALTQTGSSSYAEKAPLVPLTASLVCGRLEVGSDGYIASASSDGVETLTSLQLKYVGVYAEIPTHIVSGVNYIWLKISDSSKKAYWYTQGWVDKFI